MTEASSSPTNPKQITPKEFNTNLGLGGMRKSAQVTLVPNRKYTTIPSPIRTAAAIPVPIAPRLLIHLPTPNPTMFSTTRRTSSNSEAVNANFLLSPSASWPDPSTKTETPTKYSMIVGTYIMLFVQ